MAGLWPPMLTFPPPPPDAGATERIEGIRRALERLVRREFGVPYHFPSFRSSDPNTPDLDGYNAQLRLAFEYEGQEHYQCDHPYNRLANPANPRLGFRVRKVIDRWKDYVAAAHRVSLIRVSYRVPLEQYSECLRRKYIDARQEQVSWTDAGWDYQRVSTWRSYQLAIEQYQRAVRAGEW